jgi:hypothetical protein
MFRLRVRTVIQVHLARREYRHRAATGRSSAMTIVLERIDSQYGDEFSNSKEHPPLIRASGNQSKALA